MKMLHAAALAIAPVLALSASPVLADDHAEAPAPAFSTNVPLETLVEDERAKAVLMEHMGGQDVTQHPAYDQFKAMSLRAIAPFSQGMIDEQMLDKMDADLAKLEPAAEADEAAEEEA